MIPWILFTFIAQLMNAMVSLIDKYIVTSKRVTRPVVYAFYVGLFSIFSLLIFLFSWIPIPFEGLSIPSVTNLSFPDMNIIFMALIGGFTFIIALTLLFEAFSKADASDVVPIVGSMSAISTLFLGFIFLDTELTSNFLIGFGILVFGTAIVSLFRFPIKILLFSITSGLFFGAHYVLVKKLFLETHFDNAYLWLNLGIVVASFVLLLLPHKSGVPAHKEVRKTKASSYILILAKQIMASASAFLILKAIEFGDVSVIQALGGLQFVFLLIFAISNKHDKVYYCENCTPLQKIQKVISVVVITVGFIVLFI